MRAARAADSERLAQIDLESNPSPWSASAIAETLQRAHGLVAQASRGPITGFVLFSVAADECEILSIAVEPAARRHGIARALVGAALRQAARAGAQRCFLEVRASNDAAQALYAACGFDVDGRRKDYYREPREDALLLSRALDGATP